MCGRAPGMYTKRLRGSVWMCSRDVYKETERQGVDVLQGCIQGD